MAKGKFDPLYRSAFSPVKKSAFSPVKKSAFSPVKRSISTFVSCNESMHGLMCSDCNKPIEDSLDRPLCGIWAKELKTEIEFLRSQLEQQAEEGENPEW